MTNSSPQEPQNETPEDRRRRVVGGLTFDEMIAIIVAFTTIGAILFWTLGDLRGKFANNFGLGKNAGWLSADQTTTNPFGINNRENNTNNSERLDANVGEIKGANREQSLMERSRREESPTAAAIESRESKRSAPKQPKSEELNFGAKLAPIAGIATLPKLNNNRQGDVKGNTDKAPVATTPDGADNTGKTPVATTPDGADNTDKAPIANAPDGAVNTGKAPVAIPPKPTEIPKDMTPTYWAYPFVQQMSKQGLVAEFKDDQNFNPDKLITRSDMATLISQAFNTQPEIQKVKKFKDVTKENAIPTDVNKAVETGFMRGYSDNEFRPLQDIPRYQVLVTLATGLGLKPSQNADQILQKFGDSSDLPDWAKEQVAAAAEAGLIVNPPGVDKNSLNPNKSATRAEVAAMIYQGLVTTGKVKPIESEYIVNP